MNKLSAELIKEIEDVYQAQNDYRDSLLELLASVSLVYNTLLIQTKSEGLAFNGALVVLNNMTKAL